MENRDPFAELLQEMQNHLKALNTVWDRLLLDQESDRTGVLACMAWMTILIRHAEANTESVKAFSNAYRKMKEEPQDE